MQQSQPQNSIPYPIHIYSAGNPLPQQAQGYYSIPPSGFPQHALAYYTTPPPSGFFNHGSQGVEHQQPISLYVYPQPPPFFNPHNPQIGEGSRAFGNPADQQIDEGNRAFGNPADQQIDEGSALAVEPTTPQEELATQAVAPTANRKISIQPEFCSVCQLSCNSKIVYDQHVTGKKHLRKLALSGLPIPVRQQPVVTVMEPSNSQIARMKRKAAAVEDMESKRNKVVQGGASADQVIICTPCNVICNNRIVYDAHIKGIKHLRAMSRHLQ